MAQLVSQSTSGLDNVHRRIDLINITMLLARCEQGVMSDHNT